jgi:hypothetical protein
MIETTVFVNGQAGVGFLNAQVVLIVNVSQSPLALLVGMMLERQLFVGLTDLIGGTVLGKPENGIVFHVVILVDRRQEGGKPKQQHPHGDVLTRRRRRRRRTGERRHGGGCLWWMTDVIISAG